MESIRADPELAKRWAFFFGRWPSDDPAELAQNEMLSDVKKKHRESDDFKYSNHLKIYIYIIYYIIYIYIILYIYYIYILFILYIYYIIYIYIIYIL